MFKFRNNDKTLNFVKLKNAIEGLKFVRMEGLEPPCLAALDPKSSASTNFATSANLWFVDNLSGHLVALSYQTCKSAC